MVVHNLKSRFEQKLIRAVMNNITSHEEDLVTIRHNNDSPHNDSPQIE